VKREKALRTECAKQGVKCILRERHGHASQMGRLSRAGACKQGGLAGPDPRRRFNKCLVFEFLGFLKFGRTWRNFTKRFGRNLDMGILPKFF
jgi:hypothetical protein